MQVNPEQLDVITEEGDRGTKKIIMSLENMRKIFLHSISAEALKETNKAMTRIQVFGAHMLSTEDQIVKFDNH